MARTKTTAGTVAKTTRSNSKTINSGGRGASGGIRFQVKIGAWVAAYLAAGSSFHLDDEIEFSLIERLELEGDTDVDDVMFSGGGRTAFVQAKRTLDASPAEKSEFGKTADQFVRQFRAGILDDAGRRPLRPGDDWLLIAVTTDAARGVADHLRLALLRRANDPTKHLSLDQKAVFERWVMHLTRAWTAQVGTAPTAAELGSIIAVTRVWKIDLSALARDAISTLRPIVAHAPSSGGAWTVIEVLALWMSENGLSMDVPRLRKHLGSAIGIKAPQPYQADVARVRNRSSTIQARLRRFGQLEAPEGSVVVDRECLSALLDVARARSALVIGPPGAGKSGLLSAVADILEVDAEIVTLQVDPTADLSTLQHQLGLEHPLIEVLARWPGRGPAYLIIDALDAARGGPGEATYRELIQSVVEMNGRWLVLASVRTFDLARGTDLQRLFAGAPYDPAFADPAFPKVRHFLAPSWSDGDLAALFIQSPSIHTAVTAGEARLADLVRNPFNMSLLAGLLTEGMPAASFVGSRSRTDLLEAYWHQRVDATSGGALHALSDLVEGMLGHGDLTLHILDTNPTNASALESLALRGVVLLQDDRYAFAHHVLFDYAVARIRLDRDGDVAVQLRRHTVNGALVAPAVQFWLARRMTRQTGAIVWGQVTRLLADLGIDPIIRTEVGRLGADLISERYHLDELSALVTADPSESIVKCLWTLQTTQSAMLRGSPPSATIITAWLALARLLSSEGDLIQMMRNLLMMIGRAPIPDDAMNDFGLLARRVLDAGLSDVRYALGFVPIALPAVVRSFATEPAASRVLIERLIADDRVTAHGHNELDDLARETHQLVRVAPDLCIKIWRVAFAVQAPDATKVEPMGTSQILPLTTTIGQGFDSGRYALREAFPELVRVRPLVALLCYMAAVDAIGRSKQEGYPARWAVACGRPSRIEPDRSVTWGMFFASDHTDLGPVQQHLEELLAQAPASKARRLARFCLDRGAPNLVISRLFGAGAKRPADLGRALLAYACTPPILQCLDTRGAALALIRAVLPCLDTGEQGDTVGGLTIAGVPQEKIDWVKDPPSASPAPTPDGRMMRSSRSRAGLTKDEPYNRYQRWIESTGAVTTAEAGRLLIKANAVSNQAASATNHPTARRATALAKGLTELWAELQLRRASLDLAVATAVEQALAQSGASLLRLDVVKDHDRDAMSARLFLLASNLPASTEEAEASYKGTGDEPWPAPPVTALVGILDALDQPGVWTPQVGDLVRAARGSFAAPAARGYVASRIGDVLSFDEALAWETFEQIAYTDPSDTVVGGLIDSLATMAAADVGRTLPVLISLLPRLSLEQHSTAERVVATLVEQGVWRGNGQSLTLLDDWAGNPFDQPELARVLLHALREPLVAMTAEGVADNPVRSRARNLLERVFDALLAPFEQLYQSPREEQPSDKTTYRLMESVYNQLYFASGSFRADAREIDPLPTIVDKRAFLSFYEPLLHRLAATGAPKMTHHLLQLLTHFAPVAPGSVFDLAADIILRSGARGYQFESLGQAQVIKLIGLLLSDHGEIFSDPERRDRLTDCLSLFADVGWAEARLLLLDLPSLL